jgi:hypothetical protein
LLATTDFSNTVHCPPPNPLQDLDMFMRPVHWVLSSRLPGEKRLLLISPFEANELLPLIRKHGAVTLHAYSPRIGASMPSMEDLSLFAIPPVLESWAAPATTLQLNLFAGQLYLRNNDEYLALCRFLGQCFRVPHKDRIRVSGDGFVDPPNRMAFDEIMKTQCRFTRSPVKFLRDLMTLRRKGQSFHRSHMGKILNCELLTEDDFERNAVKDECMEC